MCKLRAYRHGCGHTATRHLSRCRMTYASPTSQVPLCHATPEITVTVDDYCQACQYDEFRTSWETRIAEAQAKQNAARLILAESDSDDYASCEFDCGDYGDGYGFNDSDMVQAEQHKAEREVERLWTQYQREQWSAWRRFITSPGPRNLRRQRKSNPRCSGESPLRMSISMDDVLVGHLSDNADDGVGGESPLSSASDSGSNPALESPNTAGLQAWSWPPARRDNNERPSSPDSFSHSWRNDVSDLAPDDDMLPNYV